MLPRHQSLHEDLEQSARKWAAARNLAERILTALTDVDEGVGPASCTPALDLGEVNGLDVVRAHSALLPVAGEASVVTGRERIQG